LNKLTFSPAATSDIDNIWNYTAENWGITQAEHYTDKIDQACNDLDHGVRQGRPVSVRPHYLKYPVERHVIYFLKSNEGLEVVRILHQRMDVERQFNDMN